MCWDGFAMKIDLQSAAAVAQIVISILSLLSFVIAVISINQSSRSVKLSYDSYVHNKDKDKMTKSCDLTLYFIKNIIANSTYIANVFKAERLDLYLKDLYDPSKIHFFNRKELLGLLGSEEKIGEVMDKFRTIHTESIFGAKARLGEPQESTLAYSAAARKGGGKGDSELSVRDEFFSVITELLNSLEWFSMNFVCGVADEELGYETLHQTFLSTVTLLYFFICIQNVNDYDRYYANIIELFRIWQKRLNNSREIDYQVELAKDESRVKKTLQ